MTTQAPPPPAGGRTRRAMPWVPAALLAAALALFLLLLGLQWGTPVTGVDGAHYITGGLHLVREGQYLDPSGSPELWFPPVYPLLIGIASAKGQLDPVLAARVVSVTASLLTIVLVWMVCRREGPVSTLFVGAALAILALNPLFERQALSVLAEATATALLFGAFAVWLFWSPRSTPAVVLVGVLSGLSYLTRPEGVLPFVIWTAIDCFTRRNRRTLVSYAAAWLLFFLIAMPYVAYLHRHTGQLSLSNKLGITLAAGRATYYGCPREYIDPATLRMTIYDCPASTVQEAGRYVSNAASIFLRRSVVALVGRPMPVAVALWILLVGLIGTVSAWRTSRRMTVGLLAQFAAIPVMAALDVKTRYLHMTLPAVVILIAAGSSSLLAAAAAGGSLLLTRLRTAFGVVTLGLVVMVPLFSLAGENPEAPLSREVGLKAAALAKGSMYESATTVAYYAGMKRFPMPLNDLDTIIRYVHQQHQEPVYLVVSTVVRHDPSVLALLSAQPSSVTLELTGMRDGVTVAVFKVN